MAARAAGRGAPDRGKNRNKPAADPVAPAGATSLEGAPRAPSKACVERDCYGPRYGHAAQVVGPVVVHTAPPVTVLEYAFFTNAVVASNPNDVGEVCRI